MRQRRLFLSLPYLVLLFDALGGVPTDPNENAESNRRFEMEEGDFWDSFFAMSASLPLMVASLEPSPVPSPTSIPLPTAPTVPDPPVPGTSCDSEAAVSCVNEKGVSCDEIVPHQWKCHRGPLQTVRFRLEFCTCDKSINSQEGFLTDCNDALALPTMEGNELVRVSCLDVSDNTLLFSSRIESGDAISIQADVDYLPEEIGFSIFSEAGVLMQSFIINTSGEVDLALTNKFGSLTLEACDVQDCHMEATYTYSVLNTGSVPLTATKFERVRSGQRLDLLAELATTQLAPGDTQTAGETEIVDLCVGKECLSMKEFLP
jgi:hypothetical protein